MSPDPKVPMTGAFVHMFNAEAKAYLKSLSIRQVTKVGEFKRYIRNMDLKTFNKAFGLSVDSESELTLQKFNIYSQLNPIIINGVYDAVIEGINDIASPRSSLAPFKATYHLLGPSGELGYDFAENTTTLRGIYEIK